MCSSGPAVILTCAGHCLPISVLPDRNSGAAAPSCSDVSWDTKRRTCKHSGAVSPLFCLPFWTPITVSQHFFFMVLCGYSFNLTSAYLWTKLLMASSSLSHGRCWQSKWAQGLGASSSKHCLHLKPEAKATVIGTFPFVLVHCESG